MLLLFAALLLCLDALVEQGGMHLLHRISLLSVPAGRVLLQQAPTSTTKWPTLVAELIGSTWITRALTAIVAGLLAPVVPG